MKDKGYVKTHRTIMDWEWYKVPNTNILFRHCVLRANFEDTKWRGIEVKRGSFITSLNTLHEETGLSVQNIRTALKNLIMTNDITSKPHTKYRIITVNNYCHYQATNKQDNKLLTSNQQTTNKQLTIDKELKEPKNLKNVIKEPITIVENENTFSTKEVIEYLNFKVNRTGKDKYRHTTIKTIGLINARKAEGFSFDEFKTAIDNSYIFWLAKGKGFDNMKPSTMFNGTFENRVNNSAYSYSSTMNNNGNSDLDDMEILYNKYKEEEENDKK